MKASKAYSLVFVDEITELRRLAHPGAGVAGIIFRVYGFALAFIVINWFARDFPNLETYFYSLGYGMLALYLAIWLAFQYPSVYRLLVYPFSLLVRSGKTSFDLAGGRRAGRIDDLTLCDPGEISGLLTENKPIAKAYLRQNIKSASNAAVVARSPASRLDSAVAGLVVAAFLFIIGAAPGLFFADSIWLPFVYLFTLGPAFMPIAWLLFKIQQLEKQRRDERVRRCQPDVDKLAAKLANLVDAQSLPGGATPERFGLYLRPFLSTGRIQANIHRMYESGKVDFEMLFAYSLKPYIPIVALGQPTEHVGAGRIKTTDSDWQALATSLIDNAKCIYIVPSNRPGTLWEVQFLKRTRALDKTLFIMPPEARLADERTLFSQHWEETTHACAAFGVHLPQYKSEGMLFKLTEDGQSLSKTAALQLGVITPGFTRKPHKLVDRPLPESETASAESRDSQDLAPAWASILLGVPTDGGRSMESGEDTASDGDSYSSGDMDCGGGGD